jgi:hypothetical protein
MNKRGHVYRSSRTTFLLSDKARRMYRTYVLGFSIRMMNLLD